MDWPLWRRHRVSLPPPAQGRIAASAVCTALFLFVVTACGGPADSGSVELEGVQQHRECLERTFPLEPTFFAARDRIDSVGLFLQSRAHMGQDADLVYIEIFAADRAESENLVVDYPSDASSEARAEIGVHESCPDLNASLVIRGEVTFERLETRDGGRVIGQFENASLVDARTDDTVADRLTGQWAFTVQKGSPYTQWPTYDDSYRTEP